jgi:hypothetical protein
VQKFVPPTPTPGVIIGFGLRRTLRLGGRMNSRFVASAGGLGETRTGLAAPALVVPAALVACTLHSTTALVSRSSSAIDCVLPSERVKDGAAGSPAIQL